MAIKHTTTKAPGEKVFADTDWNANHTIQTDTIFPDIIFPDNIKAYFGSGKDAYCYFDGSNWHVKTDSGDIHIEPAGNEIYLAGDLTLGTGNIARIRPHNNTSQIRILSSLTDWKGSYFIFNSALHADNPGSMYWTHGDYTAPAPNSEMLFRYANNGAITDIMRISKTDVEVIGGAKLGFWDVGDSNKITFKAPALVADTDYIWPAGDGNPNDVLTTDGAGNLSWQVGGGGAATKDFLYIFPDATTSALLVPCYYAVVDMIAGGPPPLNAELSGQFPQDFNAITDILLVFIPLVPVYTIQVRSMYAAPLTPYNASMGGAVLGPAMCIANDMMEVSIRAAFDPPFPPPRAGDKFGVSVQISGAGEAHCMIGVRLVYT